MTTTNPKRPSKLTYQDQQLIAHWVSIVVLVLGILLVAAIFSSTSGTPVQCSDQNVTTAGCANP